MVSKVYQFLKRKKEMLNGFYQNTKYMCAGNYVYDDSIKFIILDDHYTKRIANKIFQNNYYQSMVRFSIFMLRRLIFKAKVTIPEQTLQLTDFTGTVYRPIRSSSGYKDCKIFDFTNNQVLSIFSNKEDYQLVIDKYEYFNVHFPMPAILWKDDGQQLIMEELVNFRQNDTWVKEDYLYIIKDIFERSFDYFQGCAEKEISTFISPNDLYLSSSRNSELSFIMNHIDSSLIHLKIPCVMLHGDLWTANTLLMKDRNQVCYIDWEYSKEYFFFYDLFTLMWLEVYVNNNYCYLLSYLNGDYDLNFMKLFSLLNLSFETRFRLDYFHIFFLHFYHSRIDQLDKTSRILIGKQYKRMFEKAGVQNGKQSIYPA